MSMYITGTDNKVWRILPTAGLGIGTDAVVIVDSGAQSNITRAPVTATVTAAGPAGDPATANLGVIKTRVIQRKPPPDDAPQWARLINDCEVCRVWRKHQGEVNGGAEPFWLSFSVMA